MAAHSKRYDEANGQVDREKLYPVAEALDLLQSLPAAKFNESVDVAVRLGVDPKHADQMVRGTVLLPHGTGKSMRVVVFAQGENIKAAEGAGAMRRGAWEFEPQGALQSVAVTLNVRPLASRGSGL